MSEEQEDLKEGGAVNADAIAEAFSDDSHHDDDEDDAHYHASLGDDDEEDDSIDTNFEIMDTDKHW